MINLTSVLPANSDFTLLFSDATVLSYMNWHANVLIIYGMHRSPFLVTLQVGDLQFSKK